MARRSLVNVTNAGQLSSLSSGGTSSISPHPWIHRYNSWASSQCIWWGQRSDRPAALYCTGHRDGRPCDSSLTVVHHLLGAAVPGKLLPLPSTPFLSLLVGLFW